MNTPHKHAAIIKKWADGAEIQYRVPGIQKWSSYPSTTTPRWLDDTEYRVKPENTIQFHAVFQSPKGVVTGAGWVHRGSCLCYTDETILGVLRTEINPETLEVVSAVMEKP